MAREKTKYTGVYTRKSKVRRYEGKPDICFDISYKVGKKLVWEKVGWRSEKYTAILASEIRAERVRRNRHPDTFPPKPADLTYGQAWDIFREKRLPILKNKRIMIHHYETHIRPAFENVLLKDISAVRLEAFRISLLSTECIWKNRVKKIVRKGQTLAPSTVNTILLDMQNVISRMHQWGFYSGTVHKIKPIRVNNERQRFLTPKEVDRLLGVLEILSCTIYRVAVLSMHTGMRVGEILGLRGQDLDLENFLIHVEGKTGRRVAYMDDTVHAMLLRIVPDSPSALLFPSQNGGVRRSANLATTFTKAVNVLGLNDGITDRRFRVVFHTLRHTFCSWLASQNVPLYTIGKLVGHTNVRSTQRYAKLSPDAKWDALKLIEKTANAAHKS